MPQILISTGLIASAPGPAIQRKRGERIGRAHQRLTDEECLVSGGLQALDIGAGAQSALGHQGRVRRGQRGQMQRGFQIDLESFQIAIVDPDEACADRRGALQLLGGMNLDQRVEMNVVSRIEQLQGSASVNPAMITSTASAPAMAAS